MELDTFISQHPKRVAIERLREKVATDERYERVRSYCSSDFRASDNLPNDFMVFMALVDNAVANIIGLSAFDLCDYSFRDGFEAGERPSAVARECIIGDDLYSGFFDMED